MKILAIDTAFNACSVAVLDTHNGKCNANTQEITRGHAEILVPMITDILSSSGVAMADLNKIAVTTGPGAFTGMRVGISTAKAYGLALGVPVIGVNSFEAMLETYRVDGARYSAYAVILETKRDEYFFCVLDEDGQQLIAPECCAADRIYAVLEECPSATVLIGDAVERFSEEMKQANRSLIHDYSVIPYPNIARIAEKAQNIVEKGDSIPEVLPLYLREADVTLPKKPIHYLKIN